MNVGLAADSHRAAISCIEDIVHGEGIDCDFARVPGYLFLPVGDGTKDLDRETDGPRVLIAGDTAKDPRDAVVSGVLA